MEADTRKSSAITDHPFIPRERYTKIAAGRYDRTPEEIRRDMTVFPASPYLCGHNGCNLAEAAHSETTVERGRIPRDDLGHAWD
jgi:hypothetical protein